MGEVGEVVEDQEVAACNIGCMHGSLQQYDSATRQQVRIGLVRRRAQSTHAVL